MAGTFWDAEYLIDSWETDQGLPENSATAMVQTPDGYLWFGTYNGLVQFDGVKFTVFDPSNTPALPSPGIVNLHLDASQRLWVSTYRGLVVSEPKRWTTFHPVQEWTGDSVRTFSENAGVLCATSFNGKVVRARDGRIEPLPDPPGVPGSGYLGAVDRTGKIWVAQFLRSNYFGGWDGREWKPSALLTELQSGSAHFLTGLRDGRLLALKGRELLYIEEDKIVSRIPLNLGTNIPPAWNVSPDHEGTVWVSSDGLYRVRPSGEVRHFSTTSGLTYHAVRFAFADREQNVWVGSSGGGLMRFKRRTFVTYGHESALNERHVKAVLEEAPGKILVGTFGGRGLFRWEGGRIAPLEESPKLESPWTQCLLRDREERLWIGSNAGPDTGSGLAILSASGLRQVSSAESGLSSIRALFQDSQGRIWIGGEETITLFREGRFRPQEPATGVRLADVRCFAEDPRQGDLWAGGGEGLRRFAGGQWQEVRDAAGKPLGEVACLRFESDGSLWIGGIGSGLLRRKNDRWAAVTELQGLPGGRVGCILEDDLGHWWLGSNRGVIRVARADMRQAADGLLARLTCQHFNVSDGLASIECALGGQSNGLRDSQGRLWFATLKGVAMIDPRQFVLNTNPPPVLVERFRVEDFTGRTSYLPIPEAGPVMVPPGMRELAVSFTAINLSAPEKVWFAHRIEGLDQEWRQTVNRVVYFYPPGPGTHQFRLKALNHHGYWNETGASVAFTIQPFFWQTAWFRILAVVLAGGSIALSTTALQRGKLRRAEERLKQQEALATERARSAALTQNSTDIITLLDAEGRVVFESPSVSRILGHAPGRLLGKDPIDFVHPDDQARLRQALTTVFAKTNPGIPAEFRFRHAQGHWVDLEALGTNLIDLPGVQGILVTIRDITERKRAELALRASEERYRTFIAHSTDGIWRYAGKQPIPISLPEDEQIRLILEHGYLAECNDVMARMYGFSRADQLVGTPLRQLTASDPRNLEHFRAFIRSGYRIANVESFEKDREGNVRHFLNSFVGVVENGHLIGAWGVQRDITEGKQAELYRALSGKILEILNQPRRFQDSIRGALTALKDLTGCDAVGMRLRNAEDYPYFVQSGFSSDFLLKENSLVARTAEGSLCQGADGRISLECTCGLVISGKTDPSNPLFTPGGSFWTNDAAQLLELPASADPRLHPRNRCIHEGYASVVLAPIRAQQQIVGLLQLNDRRKNRFTLAAIQNLEGIAAHIGEALVRRQAEEALRESEERFRGLCNATLEGVMIHDEGIILDANQAFARLFGYNQPEELIGRNGPEILLTPDSQACIRQRIRERTTGPTVVTGVRKDGSTFVVETDSGAVKYLGREARIVSCRDLTDRKRTEAALRASLDEKTALLKEVHHRVKNNLQIVISLLNLQTGQTKDRLASNTLLETQNRVRSMALLHETLYRSGNLARLSLAGYVEDLCAHLFRSFGAQAARVQLRTRVEGVELNLDQAVPCGLIINELVSNSLKHAFPESRAGEISLELVADATRQVTLKVSDNGVGLPSDLDIAQAKTLGLQLVCGLAQQLGGRAEFDRGLGAACRVTFRMEET